MVLFVICKCVTLNVLLLFVDVTNSHLFNTNRHHKENNYIPIDIYKVIQSNTKYTEPQNNNEDDRKNILDALIKELIKAEKGKNKVNECINDTNVYEFKVNRISCREDAESNHPPQADHSGRTRHNTQQSWPEYEIPFIDLTKNGINAFSKDYIDISELGRSDLDRFSKDYLDVDDLARRDDGRPHGIHKTVTYPKHLPLIRNIFDIFNLRKASNRNTDVYVNANLKKQIGRSRVYSSDTSDSSFEDSNESAKDLKKNRFKIIKPKEYGVTTSEEESSVELPVQEEKYMIKDDNQSESEEESREKAPTKPGEYFVYTQGRNRIINGNDVVRRRRLEHFMPKRFHWDEDEFRNLGYYWFNGHRGRFAEAWRPGDL